MEEINSDIPQLSVDESNILTIEFTEEEVKEPIMGMERNKASGPDEVLGNFIKKYWAVTKGDLMSMFAQLITGDLPLLN
jgi:hypothetical protein